MFCLRRVTLLLASAKRQHMLDSLLHHPSVAQFCLEIFAALFVECHVDARVVRASVAAVCFGGEAADTL